MFRMSDKQKGWKEEWIEIKNITRYAKGRWLLINTRSTAPNLRSLDMYYGIPSVISDFDFCFEQFLIQILNNELLKDEIKNKDFERFNRKYNINIDTKKGF